MSNSYILIWNIIIKVIYIFGFLFRCYQTFNELNYASPTLSSPPWRRTISHLVLVYYELSSQTSSHNLSTITGHFGAGFVSGQDSQRKEGVEQQIWLINHPGPDHIIIMVFTVQQLCTEKLPLITRPHRRSNVLLSNITVHFQSL